MSLLMLLRETVFHNQKETGRGVRGSDQEGYKRGPRSLGKEVQLELQEAILFGREKDEKHHITYTK